MGTLYTMKKILSVLLLVLTLTGAAQTNDPQDALRDMVYSINVLANPATGGTVSGDGNYAYAATCMLTATPDPAYRFVSWTRHGTVVSLDRNYQFVVTEDASFEANFEAVGCQADELGYTVYDWQSNCAARTWTHAWSDGKVSFAYTVGTNSGLTDRGTAIDTYDAMSGTWLLSGGRVEDEKTGFGSIAQYGDNSIVVAAHTANDCRIYIVPDKDNITTNAASAVSVLDNTHHPSWPAVMTSGPNRDIIHVVANAYTGTVPGMEGVYQPIIYFRSSDGGQTWDRQNEVLPFMDAGYALSWKPNSCYWMETTDDNCLALVVNNPWSDGMVIYSYDNGNTWNRKVFYQHPNPLEFTTDTIFYPGWTSCQWDDQHRLHVLYAFNATIGTPLSGSPYPSIGGVAYWNETMPFVLNDDYLHHDLYASLWLFPDAPHEMLPEYIGYLTPLTEDGEPEDPYSVTETNFYLLDLSAHGYYGHGICTFPVLCRVPGTEELVAVWSALGENPLDENDYCYYKLFASYSSDSGATWSPMVHLTKLPAFSHTEFIYNQAMVVGRKMIVVSETDGTAGSYTEAEDNNPNDNHYSGLVFDLDEWFPTAPVTNCSIVAEADPASMGSVTGGGTLSYGTPCCLTATPAEGYYFVNWTRNGTEVSTSPVFNFIATEDAHYVAHFANQPVYYHVAVSNNPDQGGTVTGAGDYERGSECTLTAEPAFGYEFWKWTRNGATVSTSPSISFTVTQDVNLVAVYDQMDIYYYVSVTTNPPGCGQVTGNGYYLYSSDAMVTVVPNENYEFDHWTLNGTEVSTYPVYTFTVMNDTQVVAYLNYVNDVADNPAHQMSVYPNPVQDQLSIKDRALETVSVYNTFGQCLLSKSCGGAAEIELDLSGLDAGVYTVAIRTQDSVISKRIVKQ